MNLSDYSELGFNTRQEFGEFIEESELKIEKFSKALYKALTGEAKKEYTDLITETNYMEVCNRADAFKMYGSETERMDYTLKLGIIKHTYKEYREQKG